jgi:hypothetical protein
MSFWVQLLMNGAFGNWKLKGIKKNKCWKWRRENVVDEAQVDKVFIFFNAIFENDFWK